MNLQKTTRRAIAVGIVATSAAIGFAGSAQAVTKGGCTATPSTPVYSHHNASGNKVLKYTIKVKCSANRTVTIAQQRKEEDGLLNPDDLIGSSTYVRAFGAAGTKTINFYGTLPDTELGKEEMYQRIRIRVSSNGVTSAWSGWHKSGVRSFSN